MQEQAKKYYCQVPGCNNYIQFLGLHRTLDAAFENGWYIGYKGNKLVILCPYHNYAGYRSHVNTNHKGGTA